MTIELSCAAYARKQGVMAANEDQLKTVYHNFVTDPERTLGKKRLFRRHLMLKMIILPRQARDKHRGNSKKEGGSYRTPADRVLFVLLLLIIIIIIIIISLLA
jgi:hypothetical protein